ncbi:IS5 family transposase [Acidovorax soli]|uniref:IS5 family transposase n=1 Tax=Acidovorax soli TaxID=592050 RepID=A0A7X0PKY4_9BURK|nr:IS5 family transposase [Acidovorax soli]
MMFDQCIDALPEVRGLRGRPRCWPAKLYADKSYDYAKCRAHLRSCGISRRIARRGIESSKRLGKHRWAVGRTHAWFAGFGKLRIHFERRLDILRAAAEIGRSYHLLAVC